MAEENPEINSKMEPLIASEQIKPISEELEQLGRSRSGGLYSGSR